MNNKKKLLTMATTTALIFSTVAPALAMPDIVKITRPDGSIVQYSIDAAMSNASLMAHLKSDIAAAFNKSQPMVGTLMDGKVVDLQASLQSGDYSAFESGVENGSKPQGTDLKPTINVVVDQNGNVVENPIAPAEPTLSSVVAENGKITATLSSAPTSTPVASDFAVTQAINGAAATTITPTLVMNGAVATLTVAPVAAQTTDQSVVYSVAYKSGTAVAAQAFTVANNEAAINAVNAATIDKTQAALETNAQALGLDLTDYNKLSDSYKAAVASAVFKGKAIQPTGQYADAASINTAFNNAVALQTASSVASDSVKVINNVAATSTTDPKYDADATMQAALEAQATALGLDLTDYSNLGTNSKKLVAHSVLTNRPTDGYATAADLKAQFDAAVTAQKDSTGTAVANINAVSVTNRTAPTDQDCGLMEAALISDTNASPLDLSVASGSDYALLDGSYQLAVAKAVIKNMPSTTSGTTTTYGYANAGAIKSAFDAAVAAQKTKEATDLVTKINNCATNTAVQAYLDDANQAKLLGLDTTDYLTLGSAAKAAVAQSILDGKAIQLNGVYANAGAINVAFKAAVASQKAQSITAAIAAINNVAVVNSSAPTATEGANMRTALESYAGLLGLSIGTNPASDYDTLLTPVNVGIGVLKNRPASGFATAADVKSAFDTAVAAEKTAETQTAINNAVSAVNTAQDLGSMQAAITNNATALGLVLVTNPDKTPADYSILTDSNKVAVAQKILDDRAIQPNQRYNDAAAIKTEFNQAVAYYKQVQTGVNTSAAVSAVNNATDAGTMQAALVNNASVLGLATGSTTNPTDYYKLRPAFQTAVAQAVYTAKPTGGYLTSADILSAFNTAVAAQKTAQAAEDASIQAVNSVTMAAATPTDSEGAAMQTVLVANSQVLKLKTSTGSDYDALSSGAKLAVAKGVLTSRYAVAAPTARQFATAADILTAFNTAVNAAKAQQTTAITLISQAAQNNDVVTMQRLLESNATILSLDLTDYNAFDLGQKQQIAQAVINGQVAVPGGVYTSAATIKTVFSNAVANLKTTGQTQGAGVSAVNSATAQTIQSVLIANASVLGIDVSSTSNYSKLASDADRAAVASVVLSGKPSNGYAAAGDVETAFNNAVALNMVNNAKTVAAMQTALTNLTTELDIQNAQGLPWDKIASAVFNGKSVQPGGVYANVAAIKVVFNNAAYGDSVAPVFKSFAIIDSTGPIDVDLTAATPTIDLSAKPDDDVISAATFNVIDNLPVTNDTIKVTFSGVTEQFKSVAADATGSIPNNVPLSALIGSLDNGFNGVKVSTLKALATANNTSTLSLAVDLSDISGNHTTGTFLIKVK